MPLDFAVGILDYRLMWKESDPAVESIVPGAPAAQEPVAATVAAPDDVEGGAVEEEQEQMEASAAERHPSGSCMHPELMKLEEGVGALNNAVLGDALLLLKTAIEKLKVDMMQPTAGPDLREAKDAAIDVFSTVFRNKDKLDAIKVVLVSEILLFLNTDMEHFGLQEKIRAIQSTRRVCLMFLKKLNQLREVRKLVIKTLEGPEAAAAGSENKEAQTRTSESDGDTEEPISLNDVFAINIQTTAFLRLVNYKIMSGMSSAAHEEGEGEQMSKAKKLVAARKEASEAAILGEVIGPIQIEPVIKVKDGEETIIKVMGSIFQKTKDEDLRNMLEFEVEELILCFCQSGDPAYWKTATVACDGINISIRKKALKRLHPKLEELIASLCATGDMAFMRAALNISQVTGYSPPLDKDDFVKLQTIINQKLRLFDETKDVQLLKDISAFISATGFIQFLENSRTEFAGLTTRQDATNCCRCSSQTAPDLGAENVFIEKSVYPWMSAKIKGQSSEAAEAEGEWLQRSLPAAKNLAFLCMKAPSLEDCAPTAFTVLASNDDAVAAKAETTPWPYDEEWTSILEMETRGWKGGDWKAFAVDKLDAFRHFRILVRDNGGGDKVSAKTVKFFE